MAKKRKRVLAGYKRIKEISLERTNPESQTAFVKATMEGHKDVDYWRVEVVDDEQ